MTYYASKFLRVVQFETESNFCIMTEACVQRKYEALVNSKDDSEVIITVTLPTPNDKVFEELFNEQASHVSPFRNKSETFEISINAGRKLNRHKVTTTSYPKTKPLWYGFKFEFDTDAEVIHAMNVDLSRLFDSEDDDPPNKRRKFNETAPNNTQAQSASSTVTSVSFVSADPAMDSK
jgi:hypothetical protein